jgi:hypothetical protein
MTVSDSIKKVVRSDSGSLVYFAASLLIGVAGAIFSDLSRSGLLLGIEALIVMFVPVWMIVLAGIGLFSRGEPSRRLFRVFLWPLGALLAVIAGWKTSQQVLPDAARVYFEFRRPYIEANWKTDARTGIIYFPISYIRFDNDTEVPFFFFAFDKERQFRFFPSGDHLRSPSCPLAKYQAREIKDRVYLVRSFIDGAGEPSEPCLVTPSPKGAVTRD